MRVSPALLSLAPLALVACIAAYGALRDVTANDDGTTDAATIQITTLGYRLIRGQPRSAAAVLVPLALNVLFNVTHMFTMMWLTD